MVNWNAEWGMGNAERGFFLILQKFDKSLLIHFYLRYDFI